MKLKLNSIIEVEWVDIVSHTLWLSHDRAETELPCKCKSVGYFLNQDENTLRLSCTVQSGDKSERDLTVIPKGCITKIRKL